MNHLAAHSPAPAQPVPEQLELSRPSMCTLHVCISCREAGTAREPKEEREGCILYQRLTEAFAASDLSRRVLVKPAACLSVCPRPCGIALSFAEAWTYLFGDQHPSRTFRDVLECVSLYLESSGGFMARSHRPAALRASILGRVPPVKQDSTCI